MVLLGLLAACGDDGGTSIPDSAVAADANGVDAAPARETIMTDQPLQVGELVEGIMTGHQGELVMIHLEGAPSSLSWNIHAHMNGGTQEIYEQLKQTTVDYPFTLPGNGDWYLLMRNDGFTDMTVKVRVGLYGGVTWAWQ